MATTAEQPTLTNPAFQGYTLLRLGFTAAPILFGVDKFLNFMVYWPSYLAGWLDTLIPGTAQQFMYAVGVIEVVAGIMVGLAPWIGGYVVAAWLGGIIINLLTVAPPEYYDIALRDLGLMVGALALARLAWAFKNPSAITARPAELSNAGELGSAHEAGTTERPHREQGPSD